VEISAFVKIAFTCGGLDQSSISMSAVQHRLVARDSGSNGRSPAMGLKRLSHPVRHGIFFFHWVRV
jgi:hypothetical protein